MKNVFILLNCKQKMIFFKENIKNNNKKQLFKISKIKVKNNK